MRTAEIVWYSGTGHSYSLAKAAGEFLVSKGLDVSVSPARQALGRALSADLTLLAFPVYNWKLPPAIADYVKALPKAESPKRALAVVTMGGHAANTPFLLHKALAAKNVELFDHALIRCRDSYIPFAKWLPFMDKRGLPNEASFNALRDFLARSLDPAAKKRKPFFNPVNPLHWIGAGTPIDGPLLFMGPRAFDKEACLGCGFCLTLCPAGALSGSGSDLTWDRAKCQGCCTCINVCPKNAWRLPRFGADFYNKGRNVAEMVKILRKSGGEGRDA